MSLIPQQDELLTRSLEFEQRILAEWYGSADNWAVHKSKFSDAGWLMYTINMSA